jgi:hypothetical protein
LDPQEEANAAQKEVLFWKHELDQAVTEKNHWRDKHAALYNHSVHLQQLNSRLELDNHELRFLLERTTRRDLDTIRSEMRPGTPPHEATSPVSSSGTAAAAGGGWNHGSHMPRVDQPPAAGGQHSQHLHTSCIP